jgi:glycosyltransferase involved in cell wall biosynthesis
MRVHVVDPPAYTPPYDHALCRALAAAGADVELYTSPFAYGSVATADGYRRRELFYRGAGMLAGGSAGSRRARRAVRLAEHVPDMLRYRRAARDAQVVHFQWLAVQELDGRLLPRGRRAGGGQALVLTAHDVLPREARAGQREAQRRLYEHFDAVIVHTEHGRRRLTGELGVAHERVHVIPHGVFEHLAERPPSAPAFRTDGQVVLFFGLLRPYKGIDVLLEAWRDGIEGSELWIVGPPRMDIAPLRAAAPPSVRFVPRFVDEAELPAYFGRADLVVLPYREIEQSGVLFTALAFGKPLLLSDVGGFAEVAAGGLARAVPAGDAAALRAALEQLLGDAGARAALATRARAASEGEYGWERIAQRTLTLYRLLLGENPLP